MVKRSNAESTPLAGAGGKRTKVKPSNEAHKEIIQAYLQASTVNSTALLQNSSDANKALEAACALVSANALDASVWELINRVLAHTRGRFELRMTRQMEEDLQLALQTLFANEDASSDCAKLESKLVWDGLQRDADLTLTLDQYFALLTSKCTAEFILAATLRACVNHGSSRKLFESVMNNASLLHLLIELSAANPQSLAQQILYTCVLEHDAEDDISKACTSTIVAAKKSATNQNNWKAVFWQRLGEQRGTFGNTPNWLSMLCKMHHKRHEAAASSSTAFWFQVLFTVAQSAQEVQDLLAHGPMFYSPTSETDVAALARFTQQYVAEQDVSACTIPVIKQLLLVDHRCVEPHFSLLLERMPNSQDLVLCLAESFAKTRRIPAWIALMRATPFSFQSLQAQTEFRAEFSMLLKSLLLEHQTPLIWKAFLQGGENEGEGLNEILACAFEALVFILPCQLETLPLLDQALAKFRQRPARASDCWLHSAHRMRETCKKYREILCVAPMETETGEEEEALELSPAVLEFIQKSSEARPSREHLATLTDKEECFALWDKICTSHQQQAESGSWEWLLDLAWFFELPRPRHYFPKYFESNTNRDLSHLLLRFPAGYLSSKQLGKILALVLQSDSPNADLVAQLLLRPHSAKLIDLFPTCAEFVRFVCRLSSDSDAEELIKAYPMDEAALPVLLKTNPSYLFAATLASEHWEQKWIDAFLLKHAASANTLWMLASCLNLAKQQKDRTALNLNVGLGLQLALKQLHTREAQAFVSSVSDTFYLFKDGEEMVPLLFAFALELCTKHGQPRPFERMLERASTQNVAQVIDTLQAFAWSVDAEAQAYAATAFKVMFEFGVRWNFETIVKRRTRQLLISLARLAQVTDGDAAWRALCAFVTSGGGSEHTVEVSSRDLVVMLTATVFCNENAGKMRFLQVMLESFPQCVAGDATSAFVRAIASFEAHVVSSMMAASPLPAAQSNNNKQALVEFAKVCEKLKELEKTFRHHAVSLLCDHVSLMLKLQAKSGSGGAVVADRKFENIGFCLLDLCGEYELNQLNAVLGNGADEKLAAERRRFVRVLTESHAKNHAFKGKI